MGYFAFQVRSKFRLLCKRNLLRNLAKCLVQQLPEHLETGYGGGCGSVVVHNEGADTKHHSRIHFQVA